MFKLTELKQETIYISIYITPMLYKERGVVAQWYRTLTANLARVTQ
jgi:hypothetical protein